MYALPHSLLSYASRLLGIKTIQRLPHLNELCHYDTPFLSESEFCCGYGLASYTVFNMLW
jgi:hypothetical protein